MSEKHIRFSCISNTKNFSRKLSKMFIDEYHGLSLDSLADRLCVSVEEEEHEAFILNIRKMNNNLEVLRVLLEDLENNFTAFKNLSEPVATVSTAEEEKQSSELPVSDNTEEQQSVKNPTEQLEQVAKLVNMLKEFKGNASTWQTTPALIE